VYVGLAAKEFAELEERAMARPKAKTLTELELEIMRLIWPQEEVSVEALAQGMTAQGRPLTESSLRTMLSILGRKGFVERRKEGRGYYYKARVGAGEAEKSILRDLIDRVFDGSAMGLVAALVEQGMVDESQLAKARNLIAEREKGES
jgi:predicted transcriptional regulator